MAEQRSVIITAIVLALVLAGVALYLLNLDGAEDETTQPDEVAMMSDEQSQSETTSGAGSSDVAGQTATPTPTTTATPTATPVQQTKGGIALATPTPAPVKTTAKTGPSEATAAGVLAILAAGLLGVFGTRRSLQS